MGKRHHLTNSDYVASPRLTSYRQLPPAKCVHLLMFPPNIKHQTFEASAVSRGAVDAPTQPISHLLRNTGKYRHTDKDESFCLTIDKFFTRPLSTQPYQWGGDLPIAAGPPSHQSRIGPSWRQSKHSRARNPSNCWNPSRTVPPRSYCAVSHPAPPSQSVLTITVAAWPPVRSHGFGSLCLSSPTRLHPPGSPSSSLSSLTPRLVQTVVAEVHPKRSQIIINKTLMSCHVPLVKNIPDVSIASH